MVTFKLQVTTSTLERLRSKASAFPLPPPAFPHSVIFCIFFLFCILDLYLYSSSTGLPSLGQYFVFFCILYFVFCIFILPPLALPHMFKIFYSSPCVIYQPLNNSSKIPCRLTIRRVLSYELFIFMLTVWISRVIVFCILYFCILYFSCWLFEFPGW